MKSIDFFKKLKERYRNEVTQKIFPFWENYGIEESGAINNCITEDGVITSRNRYYWCEGRALWSFAAAYNYIENNERWLNIADNLFNYICKNAFDEDGNCVYLTDADGNVKIGAVSIHSDAFVLYGINEYYRAAGSKKARDYIFRIYKNTACKLEQAGTIETYPFETPAGFRAHSVHMVFAHLYYWTGVYTGNDEIKQHGLKLAKELLILFYNGQKDALLEYCVSDPRLVASNRDCLNIYNFGHGIEAMWFLMDIFNYENDHSLFPVILHILESNLERGWDHEYGGILLHAKLADLEIDYSDCPDKKPSWSHNEAMIATLYAYFLTGNEYWLGWHKKLDEFVFRVFPNKNLEWTNWLNRSCSKAVPAQDGLEVKCIFHTSRALIIQMLLCERIIEKLGKECRYGN
jgi:N-acylglucosamine 2-epimerase